MVDIYDFLGVSPTGFNASTFVTSWCMPPVALACVRAFLSVYCFATIFYSWSWFATHKIIFRPEDVDLSPITFTTGPETIVRSLSYFNYLSYWGLAFYFFFASIQTIVYYRRHSTWLGTWPRVLQALHSIFYSTIVCFPFLVSGIYWGSMWKGHWYQDGFDAWSSISLHILNSVFAMFEIVLTRTAPLPWLHLAPLILIMGAYVGVVYVTKEIAAVYIFPWLDPSVGSTKIIAHILGFLAAMIVIFNVVRFLIWLRDRLTHGRNYQSRRAFRVSSGSSHDTLWTYQDLELQKTPVKEEHHAEEPVRVEPTNLPEPEPVYDAPKSFPRRKSSFHVRNFARPASLMTVAPKLPGFWI